MHVHTNAMRDKIIKLKTYALYKSSAYTHEFMSVCAYLGVLYCVTVYLYTIYFVRKRKIKVKWN